MRVLINCLPSVSGGGRSYLKNLSGLLYQSFAATDRHRLVFLAHREQSPLLRSVPEENIIWLSGALIRGPLRLAWEKFNLAQIVERNGCDVVFTPYQVAPYVFGARNVLMIRNMEPFLFSGYRYSANTWLRNTVLAKMSASCLRGADRVIAVSRFAANRLDLLGLPQSRVATIHHGSPTTGEPLGEGGFFNSAGVHPPFFLSCGSMLPYRRHEDAIHAFIKCLPDVPSGMQLVIAGSGADKGYERKIRGIIESSSASSQIRLLGQVPWDTMMELYREALSCLVTTEIEACPNIALEAMASSSCIISSDRDPLPEMFAGCSLEYPARDVAKLAENMKMIANNGDARRLLQQRAVERARAFSWRTCAESTFTALTTW